MDKEDSKSNSLAERFKKKFEERRKLLEKQKRRAIGTGLDFKPEENESLAQTDEFIEPDACELSSEQNDHPHEPEKIDTNKSDDDAGTREKPDSEADRWPPYSRLPTKLTRTSPFFIMSRKNMKNRPIEKISVNNSWGKVTLEGERLSIYDETTFLYLLKVAKRKKFKTYSVTRYELCKILGRNPNRDTYKAVWDSVRRLSKTHVTIEIGDEKSESQVEMGGTLISGYVRVRRGGRETFLISFNPFILQMDQAKRITRLELQFRSQLKGDVAKALYRFYQGQRNFYEGKRTYGCKLLTLCKAINLRVDGVPLWRLKDRIKRSLDELKKHGFLKYPIAQNDYVIAKNPNTSRFSH
jgi:hypothetical protein